MLVRRTAVAPAAAAWFSVVLMVVAGKPLWPKSSMLVVPRRWNILNRPSRRSRAQTAWLGVLPLWHPVETPVIELVVAALPPPLM